MQNLLPNLPIPEVPESERTTLVEALLELIAELCRREALHQEREAILQEQNHLLKEQVEALKEEVARLKGHSVKPKLHPSALGRDKKKSRKNNSKKNKGDGGSSGRGKADETVIVKADNVPAGSRFKGYADFTVQDLIIKSKGTCYRLEKWLKPDGQILTANLPTSIQNGHFGPTLESFVLYQYYHAQVTEPLIAEQLSEFGVNISKAQVHRLIVCGKEKFHEEKDQILQVGLQLSRYIHVDDTGARHAGRNGYCTHIGNELFAWFQSTESKSRSNFLNLLRAGNKDYIINEDAILYMQSQQLPKSQTERMTGHLGSRFEEQHKWEAALDGWGITKKRHIRIVTEAALLGSAIEHGLNPGLIVISDDAGQFNVLIHALCWIHAERTLTKLIGFSDQQRASLENARTQVWDLYQILKGYKEAPSDKKKLEIQERFDAIFTQHTCFASLNLALERLHKNKTELLMVLEHPYIALHNNLSEGDIREYVKRRKISGGTHSDDGRRGRDTFASLKKTCRKLGISFWHYLDDRIRSLGRIPSLPILIENRAREP
jgi:hypothetical protein